MAQIPLHNRKREVIAYTLVDDDDLDAVLAAGPWHRHGRDRDTFWVRRTDHLMLHHFLMGTPPDGSLVDHRDGDGLNNQRSNLRFATHSQNAQNRKHQANNTSGHRGVSWHKRLNKWQVRCGTDGQRRHLGYYDDLEEAASIAQQWREQNMTFLEREMETTS